MKQSSIIASIRLLLLVGCVAILFPDAWNYFHPTTVAIIPTDLTIRPTPQATPQPEFIRHPELSLLERVDRPGLDRAQRSFLGRTLSGEISSVSIFRLTYEILSKSSWKTIRATVYIPDGDGPYPLFVFGSGTTGIADKCAPSLEDIAIENLGNYRNHMITQASQGYVGVFPDYEGYGDPAETEAYFIAESESRVLLGAIQSIYELSSDNSVLRSTDHRSVFVAGYSQGGHAALASAQHWRQLPSDIHLRGIIQYAGASDVRALFQDSPWIASYLVESFHSWYGETLDARLVLQSHWIESLAKNNSELCVNDAYRFYPHSPSSIYGPVFSDAIESDTWPASLTPWRQVIVENTPLRNLPDVPYLSLQGAEDPIVTARTQRENTRKLCAERKNIVYTEYPGVNHFQIRKESFSESSAWMHSVLAGEVIETSCP